MAIAFLALLLLPAASLAQDVSRVDLPAGWQPEGITTDGSSLYAGSLADGAIFRADPAMGEGDVFIAGQEGAVAAGIDTDDAGRLWVAGGPTGMVRAYDLQSGELLESYSFEAGFINDLATTPEGVYATDSFMPQLITIPLGTDGSLPSADEATTIPITGELEYAEGFNLNGIVAADGTLVSVHSPTGTLYRIDPATGVTTSIATDGADLTAGDGLELVDSRLYVVRNQVGRIAVLDLAPDLSSAELVNELTPEDVDVPTTGAYLGGALWVVNARFGTDPTPDTEYWITRVDTALDGDEPMATGMPAEESPDMVAGAGDAASPGAEGLMEESPAAEPMATEAVMVDDLTALEPSDAVQNLFDVLSAGEYGALPGLFCEQFAAQAAQLDFSAMSAGLPPGVDADALTQAIRIVPEVQTIETLSQTDGEATVRVAGSLSLEVDAEALEPLIVALLEATGQEVTEEMVEPLIGMFAAQFATQSFDIDEEVTVTEEDGTWVICDALGGEGMDAGSATPASQESPAAT